MANTPEPASKRVLESQEGISSHLATLAQLHTDALTWQSTRPGVAIMLDMYRMILSDAIRVVGSLAEYMENKNLSRG